MADEVEINSTNAELLNFAPLGEVFSAGRIAKNLTVKDVSNNLRLSIKQIEALESNDFSGLPQAMITRGFIRNYARLLELDAEPLLASYRARMPEPETGTLNVKTSMHQVMQSKSNSSPFKYVLMITACLVLLSCAAWFYYTQLMPPTPPMQHEEIIDHASPEMPATAPSLPEVALPAAERLSATDAVDAEAAVKTPVDNAENLSNTEAPTSTMTASVDQVPQAPVSHSTAITQTTALPKETTIDFNTLKEKAAQKAQLPNSAQLSNTANQPNAALSSTLKVPDLAKSGLKTDSTIAAIKGVNLAVTEQTWVRVTDKTGAVVYEKMLQANTADGFNGLPPFKLLIGNAKATKLTYLGQNVELSEKTRNNVARITLE